MDNANYSKAVSQQELDFIAGLEHEPTDNLSSMVQASEVFVSGAELSFFKHFSNADNVGVVAQYGNHRLFFPIEFNTDPQGIESMAFAPPQIFEKGAHDRSWRLIPKQELILLDHTGQPLPYKLRDISFSGLSLQAINPETELPTELEDIFLKIPKQPKIPLQGRFNRYIAPGTVAFELDDMSQQGNRALREYLYSVHQLQNNTSDLFPHYG
ncbi:PilZ domain-containing protein [Thalassotalea euphylliae]|uniref:PilZ domain-containing protein n=1 Tax=Thalassotalea euphylliae TaxID=1655234 RepID=A0A3E0TTJ6_9GAMM|nr:PilZ domain-containing protein [Thalassotalea euphylliae]REL27744.1 PilZ domain-containing protein [Thalassotalea euphylliae]